MGRIHADNWLWVCCCCGFLPILGLLKGLIAVVPTILTLCLPCTLISIIMLPHDICITYYSFLKTEKLGRNIKAMAMFLLPIPLILWPPSVLIATLLFGAGYGLFTPMMKTFDENYNVFCGGIIGTLEESGKFVNEFWKFNSDSYFSYLFDFRSYKLKEGEKPFDISLIQLFIGTIIGTSGSIIDGIAFTIISAIKIIPGIIRAYYELWKWYCDYISHCGKSCLDFVWFGFMFPVFLIANVVIAPGVVLVAVFVSLAGFFIGLSAGYQAYEFGVARAYEKVFEWIEEFNKESNKAVCDYK